MVINGYNLSMKTSRNISELELLAASQWGLFTAAQAVQMGVSRKQLSRMVGDGRILFESYGVYRFASSTGSQFSDVKAAWLSVYPQETAYERIRKRPFDAVVAGRTAAVLHGAGDFYPSPFVFATPKRRQTAREDMEFHTWTISEKDVDFLDGLPTTSPERTTADLIRLGEDPSLVDNFVRRIHQRGGSMDGTRLALLLNPLAERNGYKRNDGQAFANDLLARNASATQLAKGTKAIAQAIIPLAKKNLEVAERPIDDRLAAIQEKARRILADSGLTKTQEATAAALKNPRIAEAQATAKAVMENEALHALAASYMQGKDERDERDGKI